MFKRIRETIILLTMSLSITVTAYSAPKSVSPVNNLTKVQEHIIETNIKHQEPAAQQRVIEVKSLEKKITMSKEDIELIALVTMAEAEGECEEGKRLVIDTILNRVDHERFPNTVSGVIYQPNQFTSMHNGRVDRCHVDEYICQLVREELKSRTNTEVIFFHAGKYSNYGSPLMQVGNHYFSSYN